MTNNALLKGVSYGKDKMCEHRIVSNALALSLRRPLRVMSGAIWNGTPHFRHGSTALKHHRGSGP